MGEWRSKHGFPVLKPAIPDKLVVSPSEMIAIGDGFQGNGEQIFSGQSLLWRHDSFTGFFDTGTAYARHQGCANVVFCDGHVESPTLKSLFVDTNATLLFGSLESRPPASSGQSLIPVYPQMTGKGSLCCAEPLGTHVPPSEHVIPPQTP